MDDRLHPEELRRPPRASARSTRSGWTSRASSRTPCSTCSRARAARTARFTYPDDEPNAYQGRRRPRNEWVVTDDTTIVGTAGHLHPGGLWTDLYVERDGVKKHLFRSRAKYYEPAGPVSWDVSMTATDHNWRVKLKKGDVVSINATYEHDAGARGTSRWGSCR